MAIQSSFYSGTALNSRTFPSTKHIPTKGSVAVWRYRISDGVWVQMNIEDYQLINNSCVLNQVINAEIYTQLEVRVADTPNELAITPSDIGIVASISNEITEVSSISKEVSEVSAISSSVVTVSSEPLKSSIINAKSNSTIASNSALASQNSALASQNSALASANSASQAFNSKEEVAASAAYVAANIGGITIEFLTNQSAYDMGYVADSFNLFPTDLGGLV